MVCPSLQKMQGTLKLRYIDLCIAELPMAFKPGRNFILEMKMTNGHITSNVCALEDCKDTGLVEFLTVSHFNCGHLELLLNKSGFQGKAVTKQAEHHPNITQPKH